MTTINILVKGGADYCSVFSDLPNVNAISTYSLTETALEDAMEACDAICLTGGSDVDPALYGQKENEHTSVNPYRDGTDILFAETALKQGKRIIGICRGAQLLCVIAGGTLIQDVSGHAYITSKGHNITTSDGDELEVTSTHHQMMHTNGTVNKKLAWAKGLSNYYHSEKTKNANMYSFKNKLGVVEEPEVVWFPDLLGLAIQFHPELMLRNSAGRQYFNKLMYEYIL